MYYGGSVVFLFVEKLKEFPGPFRRNVCRLAGEFKKLGYVPPVAFYGVLGIISLVGKIVQV